MSYYVEMESLVKLKLTAAQLAYITKELIERDLPFIMGDHVKKPKHLKDFYPQDNRNRLDSVKKLKTEVICDGCELQIAIKGSYAADEAAPRKLAKWYKRFIADLGRVYKYFDNEPVTSCHFEARYRDTSAILDYSFSEVYT